MAQYPLEMGRKKKTSNALALQVDAEGKVKYDAIARQGQGKDKVHGILKWHYTWCSSSFKIYLHTPPYFAGHI